MKVYELEREMILGQEWAIEVHTPYITEDDELAYFTERLEYKVGECKSFKRFYNAEIDYIRCVGGCIIIVITERIQDQEVPFPGVE